MTGAAATPVFLVVFNGVVLLLAAVPLAVAIQAVAGGTWSGAAAWGLAASALLLSSILSALAWLRWRRRLRRPIDLTAWWLSSPRRGFEPGGKARGLHRLARRGLPVADGWVLAPELLAEPDVAARRIVARCRRRGILRLVVRSSFPEEDAGRLYPGVFRSVRAVDARDPGAVRAALEAVAASGRAPLAERYRRRTGEESGSERRGCVVVQRFLEVSCAGVICSFHPGRRRLDEVTVEAGPPDAPPAVDTYSLLLGRWLGRTIDLGEDVRSELLEALRSAEALLRRPAVVEFGVLDGGLVLFQLRPAPALSMEEIWTQSGPVGLNPEALPKLHRDVLYGENLERLQCRLETSLAASAVPDAPPPAVRLRLERSRLLVEYAGVAAMLRFHPRVHRAAGLLVRAALEARVAAAEARRVLADAASSPDPDAIRRRAEVQARCQESAACLRALGDDLAAAIHRRPDFAPLVPWHRWLERWLRAAARSRERLRERLHGLLVDGLRSLVSTAPSCVDGEHLSLAEWRSVRADGVSAVPSERLRERRERFEEDRASSLPVALVLRGGVLVPAPPAPAAADQRRERAPGTARLTLRALYRGTAAGRLVPAAGSDSAEGNLVIVPDASLRWLERVVGAGGALFVGGGPLLSHLALAVLELRLPTLVGLTEEEAEALAGRAGRIEGDVLIVEDVRSPAP